MFHMAKLGYVWLDVTLNTVFVVCFNSIVYNNIVPKYIKCKPKWWHRMVSVCIYYHHTIKK